MLAVNKVEAIVAALLADGDFPCHNTTAAGGCRPGGEKVCIGAAVFLEQVREGGLRANLAFRLREQCEADFVRAQLETHALVFESTADFISARAVLEIE